jgi:hypothetical protein
MTGGAASRGRTSGCVSTIDSSTDASGAGPNAMFGPAGVSLGRTGTRSKHKCDLSGGTARVARNDSRSTRHPATAPLHSPRCRLTHHRRSPLFWSPPATGPAAPTPGAAAPAACARNPTYACLMTRAAPAALAGRGTAGARGRAGTSDPRSRSGFERGGARRLRPAVTPRPHGRGITARCCRNAPGQVQGSRGCPCRHPDWGTGACPDACLLGARRRPAHRLRKVRRSLLDLGFPWVPS